MLLRNRNTHTFFLRKLALVGIIPNQLFSFSSDKDRRRFPAGLRCVFFVWSGCQFFYLCRSWKRKVDYIFPVLSFRLSKFCIPSRTQFSFSYLIFLRCVNTAKIRKPRTLLVRICNWCEKKPDFVAWAYNKMFRERKTRNMRNDMLLSSWCWNCWCLTSCSSSFPPSPLIYFIFSHSRNLREDNLSVGNPCWKSL